MNKWIIADRISDRIVVIVDDELEEMKGKENIEPLQLFAGQLLAFKTLERTMPVIRPKVVNRLFSCVDEVLKELLKTKS